MYPVDFFERLWVVDQLERLGISRYFKHEIMDCLDYVYKLVCLPYFYNFCRLIYDARGLVFMTFSISISRQWTNNAIGWSSDANVIELDSTTMAFRLLRLHGYDVSPGEC